MQTDAHMDVSACTSTLAFYMLLNFPPSLLLSLASLLSLPPCAVPFRVGRAAAGHVGADSERVRRALHLRPALRGDGPQQQRAVGGACVRIGPRRGKGKEGGGLAENKAATCHPRLILFFAAGAAHLPGLFHPRGCHAAERAS